MNSFSFISFFPDKPGIGCSTTSHCIEIAIGSAFQSRAAYPYPARRLRSEQLPSSFSFKKSKFQEHGNLSSFRDNLQSLFHELQRKSVGWVGNNISVPFQVVDGKEICNIAITSIYQITTDYVVAVSL